MIIESQKRQIYREFESIHLKCRETFENEKKKETQRIVVQPAKARMKPPESADGKYNKVHMEEEKLKLTVSSAGKRWQMARGG